MELSEAPCTKSGVRGVTPLTDVGPCRLEKISAVPNKLQHLEIQAVSTFRTDEYRL
eukprot:CAMPEP_0177395134 /NCGR_PEP_ID=MMETSP0368-20130122/55964_1 /TAXON_ID=447022 ORGANISM="Scrippsiella hangoei-like, Strain SHHI-4" /NCGR_SAMPLE_ID=MMETSP0368 /ASSEMBLY_ACC=CAM_ASM_000363 /LENGTH=55 /DNA_ID=CAMNT_0018861647 /DNA_START=187 /DNA_END=354 /DNA_ORIENTATION=-